MATGIWTAVAADYVRVLRGLLPRGRVWTRDPLRRLTRLLEGLADEWVRVHNRAGALMEEADPQTTTELLPDWERTARLPEVGDVLAPTDAERRAAVTAKLAAQGGASAAYFEGLADTLGAVDAVVTEPLAWTFVWQVRTAQIHRFVCTDKCNLPVVSWTALGARLYYLFERLKPAHTRIWWTGP